MAVKGGMDMCKKYEKVLVERYAELMNVLRRALDKPSDAELIFWNNVCEMVYQSDMPRGAKLDCLGIILRKCTGNHDLYDELVSVFFDEAQYDEYEKIYRKYNFAENLNEQGDCSKQLIWDMRVSRYRVVKDWLYIFVDEIMPAVNQEIAECENTWKESFSLTEEDMENRKKKYTDHKKRMKQTCKKMDAVYEVLKLMEDDPDFLLNIGKMLFNVNQKKEGSGK